MGRMVGADPDQLEDLGNRMKAAADRLDAARSDVSAALNHSHWEGGDADHFRAEWHSRLAPLLHGAASSARQASVTLRTNAHQQREASGDVTGTGGLTSLGGSEGVRPVVTDDFDQMFQRMGVVSLIGGGVSWAGDVIKYVRDDLGFKSFAKSLAPILEKVNLAKRVSGTAAKTVAHAMDEAGPLLIAGAALDINSLVQADNGKDRLIAGADVVFDAAEAVTLLTGPEVPLVIAGVHLGFDFVAQLPPEWPAHIANAAKDVGSAIGHAAVQGVEAEVHCAETAAKVVSGGVHAVVSRFHF